LKQSENKSGGGETFRGKGSTRPAVPSESTHVKTQVGIPIELK